MTTQEEYAERRERWAQALESGKYAQTRQTLRDEKGYCCLGVVCDLYAKETGKEWLKRPTRRDDYYVLDFGYEVAAVLLSPTVMEWIGVKEPGGSYVGDSLSNQNDNGADFRDIAAIIRSAPEGLFDD